MESDLEEGYEDPEVDRVVQNQARSLSVRGKWAEWNRVFIRAPGLS